MNALGTAPGVLGATVTTYVTVLDVMKLLGCRENKAYETIRKVNELAKDGGYLAYGQGKASKYIFAEKFGMPLEVVNAVICENEKKEE